MDIQFNAKFASKEDIEREARRQQMEHEAHRQRMGHDEHRQHEGPPPPPAAMPTIPVIDVCAGSPIPYGYIKTNDHWDPTKCGNPTGIVSNVWTLTLYLDKPVGSILDVCAGAPVPSGWVVVGTRWDPTSCGNPTDIVQNMQRIQRLS